MQFLFGRATGHHGLRGLDTGAEIGVAIVKTIGDAVMAVFPSMAQAVTAALDAQVALARPQAGEEALSLKAGIHFGPTIAVTLNDRLDYFGTSVNVAARLGGLSSGHDVVVSDRVASDPDVRAVLEARAAAVASTASEIRGLEERMLTWRVSVPPRSGTGSVPQDA